MGCRVQGQPLPQGRAVPGCRADQRSSTDFTSALPLQPLEVLGRGYSLSLMDGALPALGSQMHRAGSAGIRRDLCCSSCRCGWSSLCVLVRSCSAGECHSIHTASLLLVYSCWRVKKRRFCGFCDGRNSCGGERSPRVVLWQTEPRAQALGLC